MSLAENDLIAEPADFTHDGLQADLAAHLRAGGERWVWCNIVLGDGGRPDCFTFRPSSYAAQEMISYEVKISKEDLRSDLTSGRWQRYLPFSQGVTFALPQGLAGKKDIPPECGLIVRSERGWRHARKPKLTSAKMSPVDFMRLLSARPQWQIAATSRFAEGSWVFEEEMKKARLKAGHQIAEDIAKYLRAPEEARAIIDKTQRKAKKIREWVAQEQKELTAQRAELAKILGVTETGFGSLDYALKRRLADLRDHGISGGLVKSLKRVEEEARRSLDLLQAGDDFGGKP